MTRPALLAVVAAASIALTGCAPTGHTAIKVGSTSYTDSDINLLTGFECTIAKDPAAGVSPLSRQTARAAMATVLVAATLDNKISQSAHVTPTDADVASTMTQLEPYIKRAASSSKDRDRLRELVRSSVLGQLAVSSLVQSTLGQQLAQMSQEQATAVVGDGIKQVRATEAKKVKVVVDPSLGLGPNGLEPSGNDPSLSKAVSSFAKSATAASPAQAWLNGLPANQKCG